MECATFIDRLDEFLHGEVEGTARGELEAHLDGCADCREILALVRSEAALQAVEPPPGLAERILDRTSGVACGAARQALPGLVDGELSAAAAALVEQHLAACVACRGLAGALASLAEDLPALAAPTPPAALVHRVLARTSARRNRRARLAAAWAGIVRRPRLALEGAYLGTVVFLLAFGVPEWRVGDPGQALRLLRETAAAELTEPAARLGASASATLDGARQGLASSSRSLAGRLARIPVTTFERVTTNLGTFFGADASGKTTPEPAASEAGRRAPEGDVP